MCLGSGHNQTYHEWENGQSGKKKKEASSTFVVPTITTMCTYNSWGHHGISATIVHLSNFSTYLSIN
jgi:hypothetical protein